MGSSHVENPSTYIKLRVHLKILILKRKGFSSFFPSFLTTSSYLPYFRMYIPLPLLLLCLRSNVLPQRRQSNERVPLIRF